MCGIAGILNFKAGSVDPTLLRKMIDIIRHRGPDDLGFHLQANVGLAHARLSIIDLAGGHQPMHNGDKSLWVTFNGEIFNYVEVREQLIRRGYRFSTLSDTEVILHAYAEFGEHCVHEFNGQWAFAIWDNKSHKLFLSRDRLGVRPLFYRVTPETFTFASEIKSLLALPGVPRELDLIALDQIFTFWFPIPPRTAFKEIKELPPGQSLTVEEGVVTTKHYWSPHFEPPQNHVREQDYADELRDLLLDATRLRLRSDVPVGAYLSGGLDSSLVVTLARKVGNQQLHTFSLGYADQPSDKRDIEFARLMSRHLDTDHHELIMHASDMVNRLPEMVRHLDQPFSGVLSTFFLTELVSRHVKVVLTGDGADDLFARYGHHRLVWPLCALAGARAAGSEDPYKSADLSPLQNREDLVRRFDGMSLAGVRANFSSFSSEQKISLLNAPAGRALLAHDAVDLLRPIFDDSTATDELNRKLEADIRTSLPGEVLLFCDRLSMAHSVEARSPFLDYRIAELAATIPGRLKIKGTTLKYILRRLAAKYLPREILERPKEGFIQPNHVWLRTEFDGLLDELLSPHQINKLGLFDPDIVQSMIAEHRAATHDHAFRI